MPNLDESLKIAVVQGAVTGGGLTVIANAPNPAGQALLNRFFGGAVARSVCCSERWDQPSLRSWSFGSCSRSGRLTGRDCVNVVTASLVTEASTQPEAGSHRRHAKR